MLDWETTEFFAGMMKLTLDRETVETGRGKRVALMRQQGLDTSASDPGSSGDIWTATGTGNIEAVKQYLSKGVKVDAKNTDGATAMDSLKVDWGTTQFIVQLLQIRVDRQVVEHGRAKVAELLRQ